MGPTSRELIAGLARGDEAAFSALYDGYGARLFRAALHMLRDRQEAEDAVQDVFTALAARRQELAAVQNLPAYLFAALRNAVLMREKNRARVLAAREIVQPGAETRAGEAASERLDEALQSLPREQLEVVTMKIHGELTFEEIAAALGISANTAASRYRYAMTKLRNSLAAYQRKTSP